MQNHEFNNEPDGDDSNLIDELTNAGSSALNYLLSRISLFMIEAKIAMASLFLMLVMALLSVILLSAMWGLLCWAMVVVLQESLGLSNVTIILAMAGLNLMAALVCCKTIVSLSSAIKFNETINYEFKDAHPQSAAEKD